ncbi:DUF2637 domain-containing protein [Sphaerisporangium rhizosphaerae]|uniref:DUF2637 domain-containing protein n=1 Tax=Sphaerisporangium rhizosphaerae TaxID=2269375 RepID=A0ABW2P3V4_9ACTN
MSRADAWIRWSTAAVVTLLAVVAGIVSYRHALEVVRLHGEDGFTAYLVPATVDGLIYASSMVLLDCARRAVRVPALARVSLGLGILATLAANVAHGAAHGVVGGVVAAWPAVALVLAYETLMALIRRAATVAGELLVEDAPGAPESAPEPGGFLGALPVLGPVEGFPRAVLAAGDAPGRVVVTERLPELETAPEDVPALHLEAAERYAGELSAGRLPSVRRIKREMRLGQDNARQVRAYLAGCTRT